MNEVQDRLQALKVIGWSMVAIANELGVGHMTIFNWKKGTRHAANSKAVIFKLDSLLIRKHGPKRIRKWQVKPPLS